MKSEIRNPKSETNPNGGRRNLQTTRESGFSVFLLPLFPLLNLFRISDFGFRIYALIETFLTAKTQVRNPQ